MKLKIKKIISIIEFLAVATACGDAIYLALITYTSYTSRNETLLSVKTNSLVVALLFIVVVLLVTANKLTISFERNEYSELMQKIIAAKGCFPLIREKQIQSRKEIAEELSKHLKEALEILERKRL